MELPDAITSIFQHETEDDKPMHQEDIAKLGDISSTVDRLMIHIGLNSGIAIEELLGIRKADIDSKAQTIKIWDKKKKRERIAYIPKWLSVELGKYILNMDASVDFIFLMSDNTANKRIAEWTERLIGHRKTWLAIRRTYITRCASEKSYVPILLASENSGIPIDSIMAYYAKTPDEKRQIVNGVKK